LAVPDRLALIDYGAGNLRSVENALLAAGAEDVRVTADPDVVRKAARIVLPGVGAFAACMGALSAIPGMVDALNQRVIAEGAPFLGICVGMQLMADAGEEFGTHPGLGWIGGTVAKLEPADRQARVPHMGWNDVVPVVPHALIVPGEAYFLHSFGFQGVDPTMLAATTEHGGTVTAAVARDNMVGVQFHPEKSQAYGLSLLNRFLDWRP
jgi:imidazole glycerol-phosphate synthase subunit HisH